MAGAPAAAAGGLDIAESCRYGRQLHPTEGGPIGVILYVNRRELERRLPDLLSIYAEWGVAGIKFGFVQTSAQKWSRWIWTSVVQAAAHQVFADVHDEYRPTGWRRTYPNFLNAEGIRGDESTPSPEQTLVSVFVRNLAGPADHTFCYFSKRCSLGVPAEAEQLAALRDATNNPAKRSTTGAQVAKIVAFAAPLQFLFWYDPLPASFARLGSADRAFYGNLPSTWDEMRVPISRVGHFAVIAMIYTEGDELPERRNTI